MSSAPLRTAALALVLLAVGCGGASTRPTEGRYPPAVLYPLTEGNVWSYDIVDDQGARSLGITRVVRRAGELAEVSSNRSAPILYRVTDEGIALPAADAWLLRAPVAVGAEWPSRAGRVARVTSVDEEVSTPAGSFRECVRVEERGGDGAVAVDTTYCPAVGPVVVVVSLGSASGAEAARTEARLLGVSLAGEASPSPSSP